MAGVANKKEKSLESLQNKDFQRCGVYSNLTLSFGDLNFVCLAFAQIHVAIYFNYFGLLIFCCQNVVNN